MTTTSASCFSATPRATVAPTFPAPPTTVTLRFIECSFVTTINAETAERAEPVRHRSLIVLSLSSADSCLIATCA